MTFAITWFCSTIIFAAIITGYMRYLGGKGSVTLKVVYWMLFVGLINTAYFAWAASQTWFK